MTFKRALTPRGELELVNDYVDGFKVKELAERYDVSVRTVYRLLADYDIKKGRKNRKRKSDRRPKRELKPCGTNAAYRRHKKNGEYPCTACLVAHAQNVAEAKTKSDEKRKKIA